MYHQNIRKSLMALAISVALLVPTPMETEAADNGTIQGLGAAGTIKTGYGWK